MWGFKRLWEETNSELVLRVCLELAINPISMYKGSGEILGKRYFSLNGKQNETYR